MTDNDLRKILTTDRHLTLVNMSEEIEKVGVPPRGIVTVYTGLGWWEYHPDNARPKMKLRLPDEPIMVLCPKCSAPIPTTSYVEHYHDHVLMEMKIGRGP